MNSISNALRKISDIGLLFPSLKAQISFLFPISMQMLSLNHTSRLHSKLDTQSLSPRHVCRHLPHSSQKATEAADQPTGYLLNMLNITHASVFSTPCSFLDCPATQDLPGQLLLPSSFPGRGMSVSSTWWDGEMGRPLRKQLPKSRWAHRGLGLRGPWWRCWARKTQAQKGGLIWWETTSTEGSSVFPPELFNAGYTCPL